MGSSQISELAECSNSGMRIRCSSISSLSKQLISYDRVTGACICLALPHPKSKNNVPELCKKMVFRCGITAISWNGLRGKGKNPVGRRVGRQARSRRFSVALVFASMVLNAHAQGLTVRLPPQPLAAALETFAEQTGYQVVYRAEVA